MAMGAAPVCAVPLLGNPVRLRLDAGAYSGRRTLSILLAEATERPEVARSPAGSGDGCCGCATHSSFSERGFQP